MSLACIERRQKPNRLGGDEIVNAAKTQFFTPFMTNNTIMIGDGSRTSFQVTPLDLT